MPKQMSVITLLLITIMAIISNTFTYYWWIFYCILIITSYLWYEFGKAVGASNQVARQEKLDKLLERNK